MKMFVKKKSKNENVKKQSIKQSKTEPKQNDSIAVTGKLGLSVDKTKSKRVGP